MLNRTGNNNNKIVITFFFPGTSLRVDKNNKHLSEELFFYIKQDETTQFAHAFDGCEAAMEKPFGQLLGSAFGVGIDGQCRQALKRINHLHSQFPRKKIIVNAYGMSRGVITALLLTKLLNENYEEHEIEVNIVALTPTPGNSRGPVILDFLDSTLASRTLDMSACSILKRALFLYPNKGMPADTFINKYFYYPLIPTYPKTTIVEEDVVYGHHDDSENVLNEDLSLEKCDYFEDKMSKITRLRIIEFLRQCGTEFDPNLKDLKGIQSDEKFDPQLKNLNKLYKKTYEAAMAMQTYPFRMVVNAGEKLQLPQPSHSHRQLEIATEYKKNKPYFNKHHKRTSGNLDPKTDDCVVAIKPKPGILPAIMRNPYLYRTIKWAALGILIATILYFSGGLAGLALLPLIGPSVPSLGAWIIPIAAPLAAAAWSFCLHAIIRPIVSVIFRLSFCLCFRDNPGYDSIKDDQPKATKYEQEKFISSTTTRTRSELLKNKPKNHIRRVHPTNDNNQSSNLSPPNSIVPPTITAPSTTFILTDEKSIPKKRTLSR